MGSRELRPQLGLFGKLPKELGEPWRQQDRGAAQDHECRAECGVAYGAKT
ncbi:hypothetical protein [Streptomyces capitiformicae]|uniref:Uncharacterized protein n=1 Tax=Streptomyces capitiformicae TaxID=2014920 RepID=A0A919DMI1_9ACTN|nr:hypothetical protein [Streptomyces capitiformicae]GHE63413.1 hypothetical protein GCM10017771_86710 [Streptomyces capitiformicae]